MSTPRPRVIRFERAELAEQLEAFASRWPAARADRRGLVFQGEPGARLRVPLTAPRLLPGESVLAYAARLSGRSGLPERQLLLLLQAGAMAIGYWDGDELVQHKAVRRYVVRGSGRAQPLHAKTRGKSRYGSRLRLQNWKRLLVETNQRLRAWYDQFGAPERLFLAVPVRALADLFAVEPGPPFARDDAVLQRIPMHVHRPDFAELQRVRRWLAKGRLELPG
jgi:Bacteroidetes VLRF1 release factor